jgi:hypothetical protein
LVRDVRGRLRSHLASGSVQVWHNRPIGAKVVIVFALAIVASLSLFGSGLPL